MQKKRGLIDLTDVEKDVTGKNPQEIRKKQRALKISIYEGNAASVYDGFGANYITPFAEAIKASAFQIGILSSLPGLIGPLAQLYGSKQMQTHSRKSIVTTFALLQGIMWIPIIILAFLAHYNLLMEYIPLFLIIAYTLVFLCGGILAPPWFSWMGDLIPGKDRGRYFGARNTIVGIVALVAVIIGAVMLDAFKTRGLILIGFAALFTIATAARFVSYTILKKQYAPEVKKAKHEYRSFWQFIRRWDNYGKFSFYQLAFNFAIMIASPFFALYMLRELHFTYLHTMLITISSTVFYLLFLPLIGKFSDRFGNRRLLVLANICFVFTPLLWLPSKSILWLIFAPQLIAGLANAALVISTTNFTYEALKPEHRPTALAYANILIGVGTCAGSLLGGYLVSYIHLTTLSPYFFIFILAAAARALVGIIFLPTIKDQRRVAHLPPLHLSIAHPFKTMHAEIGWFHALFADKKGKIK